MIRYFVLLLIFLLIPLGISELWLRNNLWQYASYTNSASIDQQLRERDSRPSWDFVFVGDSEVRWGINPIAFETGLLTNGAPALSAFNHGFDGFGGSWWSMMMPKIFNKDQKSHLNRYVVVGVQMVGYEDFWNNTAKTYRGENCGELQRPVLTSAFGIDIGMEDVCRLKTGLVDNFISKANNPFWLIRYRSAIKSIILPGTNNQLSFNSAKSGDGFRGFEPHAPIANNPHEFEAEFSRWRKQFDGHPEALSPMPPEVWKKMVAYGGYFDRMSDLIRSLGAEPIFFALPTNPIIIDYFQRRKDYLRHSALLHEWSINRGVIAIDLGILDREDANIYFSDMRHLSYIGAVDFSNRLAGAIAAHLRFLPSASAVEKREFVVQQVTPLVTMATIDSP